MKDGDIGGGENKLMLTRMRTTTLIRKLILKMRKCMLKSDIIIFKQEQVAD